jgi:thioredoxin
MYIFRPVSIIGLLVTLCFTACFGNSSDNSQNLIAQVNTTGAKTISETEFGNLVMDFKNKPEEWVYKGEIPSIVSFTADWCAPCRRMNPILDELANQYAGKINIYKVNVDHSRNLASFFGVQSIPTLLFSPMKGMPALQPGGMSKEQFINAIENFLLKE